ncbi:MAG: helix-turn-helix transcriptional regulator [Ruminococcaceae bacterium]|nr:helix-turn-helix transcriptional regulator [Oscillospiraceae bacterium]
MEGISKKEMLEEFGTMLREKRMQKNLTQEKLSELAGITDVYLRDLERGSYSATWLIWLKLCTILEIDISKLQQKLTVLQNS